MSLILLAQSAQAIPLLQVFIEGATYDPGTQTWAANFSSEGTVRLWTIGNVSGAGGKGTIFDVKLAIAYDSADTPSFSFEAGTTGGYGGFTDPSTPIDPSFIQTKTDGSVPTLADGSELSSHGEYGVGTSWSEYGLGNFTLSDSPLGDFMNSLPSPVGLGTQINVYELTVTGTESVHFDLYGVLSESRVKFAPYSHDAEGQRNSVPDGGSTLALLGASLLGLRGIAGRVRKG